MFVIGKSSRLAIVLLTALPIAATAVYYFLKKRRNKGAMEDEHSANYAGPMFSVPNSWTLQGFDQPLVIVMVGLPARGKSYIVKMLIRYLNWSAYEADVFNVGSYRRKIGLAGAGAGFFDLSNKDNKRIREEMAEAVQNDMYLWLQASGDYDHRRVAIFDATNTTKERRNALLHRARKENCALLFIESICDNQKVLERNYDMKLQNDDYKGMDMEKARADFLERVRAYEKVYQPLEDDEDETNISYIKLINVGQKIVARNCTGFLPSQVAFYLQNIHIEPRRIFLSLLFDGVGGCTVENDMTSNTVASSGKGSPRSNKYVPSLSGQQYIYDLTTYLKYQKEVIMQKEGITGDGTSIVVLTGTSKAHAMTTDDLSSQYPCYATPLLDELNGGEFHGLTYEQLKKSHPLIHQARESDKLHYRYPGVGGESYIDVIERVKPIIIELERQRRSVVLVCHRAVLRCIYAYFMGTKMSDVPTLPFDAHKLYSLSPGAYGCSCEVIDVASEVNKLSVSS